MRYSISITILLTAAAGGGCAPRAWSAGADHPANPDAPAGRLAGPPPALRAGAIQLGPPAAADPEKPTDADADPAPADAPDHDHGAHR